MQMLKQEEKIAIKIWIIPFVHIGVQSFNNLLLIFLLMLFVSISSRLNIFLMVIQRRDITGCNC